MSFLENMGLDFSLRYYEIEMRFEVDSLNQSGKRASTRVDHLLQELQLLDGRDDMSDRLSSLCYCSADHG